MGPPNIIKEIDMCVVEGCSGNPVSFGRCDMHRIRWEKHGTYESTRPKDWGKREQHPLYGSWTWMHRSVNNCREKVWDDFWQFVKDVGEKPTKNHRLKKIDRIKPFGPDNFVWEEMQRAESQTNAQIKRNLYMKMYRDQNKDKIKNNDLLKSYGITLAQYNEMSEKQGHTCAICGLPETDKDQNSGKPRKLAVDHCHNTGKVRGLLCGACNKGIGYFQDDTHIIQKAINYLKENTQ
jgi:Recombination endonuclease VII